MREYQKEIVLALRRILGEEVREEWDVAKDSQDALTRELHYCPRLDVAAGPFNIDLRRGPNVERINSTFIKQKNLLNRLRSSAAYCGTNLNSNVNPRCFLAIEIEGRSGTRKQRLGSILNASAIGKIGIAVGWDAEVTGSLRKIRQYLDFLCERQKTAWRPQNVIIIERLTFLSGLASQVRSVNDRSST